MFYPLDYGSNQRYCIILEENWRLKKLYLLLKPACGWAAQNIR